MNSLLNDFLIHGNLEWVSSGPPLFTNASNRISIGEEEDLLHTCPILLFCFSTSYSFASYLLP